MTRPIPNLQAAEKEAALAQQEEEKVEQRKRARAEKKALKKKKKTRGSDKSKADEDDEKEWGDDEEGEAWSDVTWDIPELQTGRRAARRTFLHLRISCLQGANHPPCPCLPLYVGAVFPSLIPRPCARRHPV